MWPVLLGLARTYAPYLVFPFAVVAGTVGYAIEGAISDRATPAHHARPFAARHSVTNSSHAGAAQ